MGIIEDAIKDILNKSFNPSHLEVIDESYKHAGHAGAADHAAAHGKTDGQSAESHFHVKIASESFDGLARLARHRAVMAALSELMEGRVHALSLEFV